MVAPPAAAFAPAGEAIYAIGDIHGRADLLAPLLRQIEADIAANPQVEPRLVTLGDYIDRGAESRRVIDMLIDLQAQSRWRMTALRGNHEAAMLDFLRDPRLGAGWCEFGGRDTLQSYGVIAPRDRDPNAWAEAQQALRGALPEAHVRFLSELQSYAQFGDYVFVHAGLKPRTPLEHQVDDDMLWIRDEFLRARPWSDQVVVHGHTPSSEPAEAPGRIGVDTGAYATGVLTAVRLQADQRRYIQTGV